MSHKRSANAYNDITGPKLVEMDDASTRATLERIEELLNKGKGKQLDEEGREVPDPRPVAPPIGYVKQPSMVEHIRSLVRSTMLQQAAEAAGMETFEDADDFDVDDEQDDPRTPYEAVFDPPAPTLPEVDVNALPEPPEPRREAPQAQGTQPLGAGEEAPPAPPAPPPVAPKGSPSPRPPIPPKRA